MNPAKAVGKKEQIECHLAFSWKFFKPSANNVINNPINAILSLQPTGQANSLARSKNNLPVKVKF